MLKEIKFYGGIINLPNLQVLTASLFIKKMCKYVVLVANWLRLWMYEAVTLYDIFSTSVKEEGYVFGSVCLSVC